MRFSAINALVVLGSLSLTSANKCIVKDTAGKVATPGIPGDVKAMINSNLLEESGKIDDIAIDVKADDNDSEAEDITTTITVTVTEEATDLESDSDDEAVDVSNEATEDAEDSADDKTEASEIEKNEDEKKADNDETKTDADDENATVADESKTANDAENATAADESKTADAENITEADAEVETECSSDEEEISIEVTDDVDSADETESAELEPTGKTNEPEEPSAEHNAEPTEEPTEEASEIVEDDPTKDFGDNGTCTFNDADREDCGFTGITEKECVNKGCCYKPTDIFGKPWCYYSSTGELINSCAGLEDSEKVACKATTEDACAAEKGCCWKESNDESVPSCYYNRASIPNPDYNPDAIITVRFEKPKTWDSVCLWSWDGANNLYGGPDWPGKPIEDLGNGWWSHTFEKGVSVANVIFNNCDGGNTVKTNDITNVKTNTCFKLIGSVVITTTDCGLDLDMCVADAEERIQCGSSKISKEDCIAQSCCYSELEGAPSCFYGKGTNYNNPHGTCMVDHTLRSMCGKDLKITKDECEDLGCCWDLSEDNDYPSCFYHGALQPTCSVDQYQRKSCGYTGISEEECTEKFGCCYNTNGLSEETFCYFQDVIASGSDIEAQCPNKYKVKNLKKSSTGMTATLDLMGEKCEKYDVDIQKLDLKVTYETDSRLHVHVQPVDIEKYPHNTDVPADTYPFEIKNEKISEPLYSIELEEDGDFDIVVKRKGGDAIFNTKPNEFVFEQQFLQLMTDVPINANIYGFGEVVSNFKRNANATRQAMFALDVACPYDQNVYGAHPFYIEIADDGSAYGVFLKNAHGMDFILEPGKLAFRINGGNIDLYFFMGPTVQEVISQYYKVIGQPALMPYWPLGFHQCRYGYPNIDKVESVVAEYKKQQIPLDTMWIDIDYMDKYKDFTYDPVNFPVKRVKKFVDNLHENHQYYINMIDPAISTEETYPTFQRGVEKDVFVKNASGDLFRGKVWPGETVFPDFHHPNALEYWTNEIRLFKEIVNTDGNWFDMNEAANFCNGECAGSKTTTNYKFGVFNPNNPPYGIFDHKSNATPLNYKNMDMDATYYGGLIEYDIHNMYGHMESVVSYQAFLNIDPVKRPFILSRSTFSGSGRYVAHWLGDNYSTWDYLAISIPGMLNFQMFGIPLVGSDICGFNNDANEELCTRWMELGAFYPFARNHNGKGQVSQEPYEWKSTAEASRRALAIRYELLPYWYTNMVKAHTDSYMMVTPLAFEWPTDSVALDDDKQFLVGRSIMITPVLTEGATSVSGYFPTGKWYDWYDPTVSFQGPTYKKLDAPLEHIPVHIRGGFVIPVQGPKLTVYENRNSPFGLIVALDAKNKASGEIYLDDGVSIDIKGKKSEIKYSVENDTLTATGSYNYDEKQPLNTIRVLGVSKKPSEVVIKQGKTSSAKFTYEKEVLVIKNAKIDMNSDFTVTWA